MVATDDEGGDTDDGVFGTPGTHRGVAPGGHERHARNSGRRKDATQGIWKNGLRRGGGGHGCRLKEGGGGWETDIFDRTYVWSSLSALLSLFFYYGMKSLMFKTRQMLT